MAKAVESDEPDELLDLVDNDDKVIGSVFRNRVYEERLELPGNVRAADAFIVNSDGRIFVPRRSMHKWSLPGAIDFSAGEHVKSGESYLQAMVRGFKEELNITVAPADLVHVGTLNLRELGLLPYHEAVFVYRSDEDPDYNKQDYMSHEWLTPDELQRRLESGEPAKVNMLYALKCARQANI